MAGRNVGTSNDENLSQFRVRVLIVLLLVLVILLAMRSCVPGLGPQTAPTEPPPVIGTTVEPTDVLIPTSTSTPIPPTPEPPPPTPSPSPTVTGTPMPTAVPPTGTPETPGFACRGIGEDRGSAWKVQGCDTLYFISRVTGVSLEAILEANPEIFDPDIIFPGQLIRLPGRD